MASLIGAQLQNVRSGLSGLCGEVGRVAGVGEEAADGAGGGRRGLETAALVGFTSTNYTSKRCIGPTQVERMEVSRSAPEAFWWHYDDHIPNVSRNRASAPKSLVEVLTY
jgi:hypothetical protein